MQKTKVMTNKKSLKWVYILAVFIVVFFLIFVTVLSVLGVPLWWAIQMKQLSSFALPTLIVQTSPETPSTFNEQITITVSNSSNQLPVNGAEVLVMQQGMSTITLYTNAAGQITFPYINRITEVQAKMEGIDSSSLVVIPANPTEWVNSRNDAYGSAVLSAALSTLAAWTIQRSNGKRGKRASVRKRK
jgi:hypothetical protein